MSNDDAGLMKRLDEMNRILRIIAEALLDIKENMRQDATKHRGEK